MGEHVDQIDDIHMNNTEGTFDNLTVLKEFSNIVNLIRNEDLLDTLPKAKLKRIKWVPMFNYLKQSMYDDMVQQMESMWKYENMAKKFEILEKQKEKFISVNETLWRPKLGDIKAQLKAHDAVCLNKHKELLETTAKEHEARINRLRKIICAKRGYIIAYQMDIDKYYKKSQEITLKLNEKIQNNTTYYDYTSQNTTDSEERDWEDEDLN